jgi:kynurenine formamidase
METVLPSSQEISAYFQRYSNWGRWGDDDALGTLNFITPEKVRGATALVSRGIQVSCGRLIEFAPKPPRHETPVPPLHFMSNSGEAAGETGFSSAHDWVGLPIHGGYITHLDSHAHAFWDGRMYNGRPASLVATSTGARAGGVGAAGDGIVARGVLLDIAGLLGVTWLDETYKISPEELDAAAERQRVTIQAGDAVMVRTGYGARRVAKDSGLEQVTWPPSSAGLSAATIPWIYDNSVAMIGTDTGTDARPTGYPFLPVHAVGISAMGLWILDSLELEALAVRCAEFATWEFLLVVAALKLKNTTGSPVNPIAVF